MNHKTLHRLLQNLPIAKTKNFKPLWIPRIQVHRTKVQAQNKSSPQINISQVTQDYEISQVTQNISFTHIVHCSSSLCSWRRLSWRAISHNNSNLNMMVAPMATITAQVSRWCSFFSIRHELPEAINNMLSNVFSLILLAFPKGHIGRDDRVRRCNICIHRKFIGPQIIPPQGASKPTKI